MPRSLPSNTVIAALPNSARRSTGRPAEASDLRQLARLDQVNQHVPLVFLQDREVPGFTDAHLVALDGDFRTVDARWAERHLQAVHFVSSLSSRARSSVWGAKAGIATAESAAVESEGASLKPSGL